jgi:hypothetical protein
MRYGIALAIALAAAPAAAQSDRRCEGSTCRITLTPQQLLASADRLVADGLYAQATPLLAALRLAPGFEIQTRFLAGLIASKTGDQQAAVEHFKAILADDPNQTRVRLELGRALLALGKPASADRQFGIAAQDVELPQEIARTIRTVRDTIRGSRAWRLDVNLGIAPDSNINNATSAQSITILLGDTAIPLELNEEAQSRSGTGQVGSLSAGLRLPLSPDVSAIAELDGAGTNYTGSDFDDYIVQAAAGAEYRLSESMNVSLQTVAAQRWFGGEAATRQVGVRLGGQKAVGPRARFGVQADARRTSALFDPSYSGWQAGVYGTYERAVSRTLVASLGPFVRRDHLREKAFSNTEIGGNFGIGGELRHGINFGTSIGLSRAVYDAPLPIFDAEPRADTRFTARATLGNRKLRVLGLSPQLVWTYTKIDSSLRFYETSRSRLEFTLARFF